MNELWRPVVGYESYYEVSSLGRVRRIRGGQGAVVGKVLTWHVATSTGYPNVRLVVDAKARGFNVHNLVTRAFLGPKPVGLVTRHLDGDKMNNEAANLRYGTSVDNARDKRSHGTASGWYKLSPEDVVRIRDAVRCGERRIDVAAIYGVSHSHVCRIVSHVARVTNSKRTEASNRTMDRAAT